jgi:hypothetical protein
MTLRDNRVVCEWQLGVQEHEHLCEVDFLLREDGRFWWSGPAFPLESSL